MIEVSSTGALGSEYRSEERFYTNNPYAVNDSNVETFIAQTKENLNVPLHEPEHGATRSVVRTIISKSALMLAATDNELAPTIEAASPIARTDDLLAYFARNYGHRQPSEAIRQDMYERVEDTRRFELTSHTFGLPARFSPVEQWHSPEQLAELWGETFGWTVEGCAAFLDNVATQAAEDPSDRTTWFQGITDGDILVAASMAERLDVPSNHGPLPLVELTEWAVHPEYRGHGLGKYVVSHNTSAVEASLSHTPHLAFAEANIISGAHHVGVRAGLHIPSVELPCGTIKQVVLSNVRVGDGLEPKGQYRNFALVVNDAE